MLTPPGALPFRVRHERGARWLDWCEIGAELAAEPFFAEPFFDPAIDRHLRAEPRALRTTPLDILLELAAQPFSPPRALVIFHLSRCGSTLLTRILATLPQLAVFSEPAVLEAVLRGGVGLDLPPSQRTDLLRGLLRAFASHRPDAALVIKPTARAVEDAAIFAEAWPELLPIFVYRDPVEVLVSLVGSQADRLPPGLAQRGLLPSEPNELAHLRPAEFWARVLARHCQAALTLAANRPTLLVPYRHLPGIVWQQIAPSLGLALAPADIAAMQQVASQHAKNPRRLFTDDSLTKQQAASDEIRELANTWVRPLYEKLESLAAHACS